MAEISLVSSKHIKKANSQGWRKMGRALAFGMAGAFCLTAAASPLDGVFRSGSQWGNKYWTARELWDYHRLVQNGGVAYLMVESFGAGNKLDMNVNGLTLAGLQIETLTTPIYSANGYSLNMCGSSSLNSDVAVRPMNGDAPHMFSE